MELARADRFRRMPCGRVGQMTHSFTLESGRMVWEQINQWWNSKEAADVGGGEQGHFQAIRRGGG
jgi:hypothetical protein